MNDQEVWAGIEGWDEEKEAAYQAQLDRRRCIECGERHGWPTDEPRICSACSDRGLAEWRARKAAEMAAPVKACRRCGRRFEGFAGNGHWPECQGCRNRDVLKDRIGFWVWLVIILIVLPALGFAGTEWGPWGPR